MTSLEVKVEAAVEVAVGAQGEKKMLIVLVRLLLLSVEAIVPPEV